MNTKVTLWVDDQVLRVAIRQLRRLQLRNAHSLVQLRLKESARVVRRHHVIHLELAQVKVVLDDLPRLELPARRE